MGSFIMVLIIGISLSMDAFSLALIYGISGMNQHKKIIFATIVGLFHFFMPIVGLQFGNILDKIDLISINLIASIILIYIGLDLILSTPKESININKIGSLMFGFSVSIDSLTVGIGLKAITNKCFISAISFCIISGIFTYLGLTLGNIISKKIGKYSRTIGGLILIIISVILFITQSN